MHLQTGYREASGIVEDFKQQYGVDNTPNFRTIHWRIKKLRKEIISLSIHEESKDMVDIEVVIDSMGIKVETTANIGQQSTER